MAGSAVRLVGEDLGAGDGHAERHAHAVRTSRRVPQIVRVGERGAGPCGGQTVSDLLCAVQVRLVARIMLDARVPVGPVGGELRVPGLVGAVEPGEQLHALESQVGLRVEAVEVVEAGDAAERVGHGGAVRVREAHGPLATDAFRRVDAAQRLAHVGGHPGVVMDDVDPETAVSDGFAGLVEVDELTDVAAVPLFQRDGRADPVFRAVRVGPCAHVRQGGLRAEPGRPMDVAARLVPGGGPVRVEPGVGEPGVRGVEREAPVVGGHVRVLQGMGWDGRSGRGESDRAVRGCADLAGVRLGPAVRVVAEPVGLGEAQIVEDVAVDVVAGAYRFEGEAGDRPGGDVRAGVGLPLPVMVTAGMVRAAAQFGFVAHLRGDDLADVARLVAVAVDGGSRRVLGGFLAGFANHDAHPVEVGPVEAGVFQLPAVGHARDGGDVLVEGGARLSRDEFRVLVAGLGVLL